MDSKSSFFGLDKSFATWPDLNSMISDSLIPLSSISLLVNAIDGLKELILIGEIARVIDYWEGAMVLEMMITSSSEFVFKRVIAVY